jgi:N utilization substance protein B
MKHPRPDGVDPHARSRARRRALQAVYAWQLSSTGIEKLIEQFRTEQDMEVADVPYFEDLVRGVEANLGSLDEALAAFLDRDIAQVDPIERAVLRIAAYELRHRIDVPYRVVINEAIETTKRFGSEHGHTYVNGVLDHAAAQWRAAEAQAPRRS